MIHILSTSASTYRQKLLTKYSRALVLGEASNDTWDAHESNLLLPHRTSLRSQKQVNMAGVSSLPFSYMPIGLWRFEVLRLTSVSWPENRSPSYFKKEPKLGSIGSISQAKTQDPQWKVFWFDGFIVANVRRKLFPSPWPGTDGMSLKRKELLSTGASV